MDRLAGLTIPSNSIFWVHDLSCALANSASHLTLEFLKEWVIGFSKADTPLKTASLLYVGPWLAHLDQFSRPTRDHAEESVKQVRGIVRSLVSITVAERRVSSQLLLSKYGANRRFSDYT